LIPLPWAHAATGKGYRDPIKGEIADQEEHHRTLSFVDELKQLLGRNGVEYGPKYFV
jgi:hypothetical protein